MGCSIWRDLELGNDGARSRIAGYADSINSEPMWLQPTYKFDIATFGLKIR